MKTTSAAIKLLIFVVLTSLATGVLAMTIANMRFSDARRYNAMFTDVAGLLEKDDVRVAGVRVGQVEKIELSKDQKQAKVTFSVNKEGVFRAGLPASTQIQVRYRNLMGQRYLAMTQGPGADATLREGGTIPVTQTKPALDLTVLFNGFRPLFRALEPDDVNKLAYQIVQTLQGEAGTVNSLLTHVASLTNTLADRDKVIGQVINNLNDVLGTIDNRHDEVNRLIGNLRQFVSGVSDDREAIFDSITAINELEGTTADLLQDGRPLIQRDIAHLKTLATTLNRNEGSLNTSLGRMPGHFEKMTNISSYGSWFNMYICGLDARVRLPGGPLYQTPRIVNENARCK